MSLAKEMKFHIAVRIGSLGGYVWYDAQGKGG